MSSRPRSLRATRLSSRRPVRPRVEGLEARLVLSQQLSANPQYLLFNPVGGTASLAHMTAVDGIPGPFASSMTPQEIQSFYGTNSIFFNSLQGKIQGDGAGQTIAIVDAYDDPNLIDTGAAGFSTSDLAMFDKYFGLPDPPSFTKYSQTGSTTSLAPKSTNGWSVEESLDVEWAHVIAPMANIDLVEATTQIFQTDMIAAVKEAASLPGVSVVSMSFGYPELPTSQTYNSDFVTPAGHQGVTFVAATSDIGSFGAGGIDPFSGQPAFLPNVISVGGTSLDQQKGLPTLETSWNQGGGGVSQYISEPSYQQAVQATGKRTTPDVSADANPDFGGVAVYDSYDFGSQDPWSQVGGTSLATPMWAAMIAIANQGRASLGADTLDGTAAGPQQALQALYSVPYSDFNDIVGGGNEGPVAKPGYDMASGLGSPRADLLVPDLAAYGLSSQSAVTTNAVNITVQPPQAVGPGSTFGFAAAVQDAYGNTDASFQGQAVVTSSLTGNVVATGNVVNGVAVIGGLSLGSSGQSATYTVTITGNGGFSLSGTTSSVTASATGSLTLYPAPSFAGLAAALQTAASSTATDITIQLQPGTYQLSANAAASLLIENTGTASTKTITIQGAAEDQTFIVPIIPQGWTSSIISVLGTPSGPVNVNIEGLTIEDGLANNGGITGKNAALGGGILIDGGNVMLSNVGLVNDRAVGQLGQVPGHALRKLAGAKGGAGSPAAGGALYMAGGTLTLNTVSFVGDLARGGRGGTGGVGGTDGGRGGAGGTGGSASGGAAYIAGGTVGGVSNVFRSDAAVGGSGGYGGAGGLGGTPYGLGSGGAGGFAGLGLGGGLFVGGGKVSLATTPFTNDLARGGIGGSGGLGGFSHPFVVGSISGFSTGSSVYVGRGGLPTGGADAAGGGVYVGSGSLTLGGSEPNAIQNDRAMGGFEGLAGLYRFGLSAPFSAARVHLERAFAPVTAIHYGSSSQPANNGRQATSQARVALPGGKKGADVGGAASSSGNLNIHVGYGDGGGIYVNSGTVNLSNQLVSNDLADYGGGIFNNRGTITAAGLTMGTDAAEIGGAVLNKGTLNISVGSLNADKASHSGNMFTAGGIRLVGGKGSTGGAIANYGNLGLGSVAVSNASARLGGAIYSDSGTVQGSNLTVSGNSASARGGGIYSLQGSLTISGGTISNNRVSGTGSSPSVAVGSGGGIDVQSGKVSISGVAFQGNAARAGGGLYLGAGSATITDSTFDKNVAHQVGGAILGNGTLTISQGSMTGNTAAQAGGAVDAFGQLTMDFVTLSGNLAGTNGGALNIGYKASLDGVTITGNSAVAVGGGINNGGTVNIVASTIGANTASEGGGLYDVGRITMSNGDKITQNVASHDGGGVYLGSGGRISASGTAAGTAGLALTNNSVVAGNGGGIFDQHGALTIVYGEIGFNVAPASTKSSMGWGGGLFDSGGKVTLSNTPVESNSAVSGAGMYITAGSVTLSNDAVTANTASQAGGGVLNQGILTLSSATVTMNVAQAQGGGGIEDQGKLTIINSTLSQNTAASGSGGNVDIGVGGQAGITQSTIEYGHAATGGNIATISVLTVGTSTISFGSATSSGGGIENGIGGTVVMANTTVADNTSLGNGGGIDSSATLKLVNDTVAYNQVLGLATGSGLDIESGTATLLNTIVDANSSASGADLAGNLAPTSSNNLFGSVSGTLPVGLPNPSGVSQPLLGALAFNGGPTQTIALLAGSPAIDAGSTALGIDPVTNRPLKTDQRGALRGALGINAGSTVDIGAYEASSSYLVTSPVDSAILAGTLRSGVQWATYSTNANPENLNPQTAAPNTIVFDTTGSFATSQTINLASTLTLPDNPVGVEILGPGGGVVNIQGNGSFQDISIPGGPAILDGITVGGGSATNGGGIESAGNLTLNNVIISGNTAAQGGGGVYSSKGAGSSLTITGGTITGNTAGFGAGVVGGNGLTISATTITGNSATEVGGGIDLPDGGSLSLTDSTVTQNTATSQGGGLYLGYATATISGGSISGNSGIAGGGLYSAGTGSSLTITGTSFSGNTAISGGAIESMTGPVTISAASLANNSASNSGGALDVGSGAQVTILASTLTANSVAGDGGAISNGGSLSISATTLSGNSGGAGGAIWSNGKLTVDGSTLSGNSAAYGGAINDTNGLGDVLTNVTLADNSAATGGGAVYSNLSNLTLVNATVAYNSVGSGGAGAGVDAANNSSVNLYNTIVDLNTGASDVAGTIAGSSNMLSVINPGLASGLAFNGGTTQTIALLAGSPALDGGIDTIAGVTVPATDQRGAIRGGANTPSFAYAGPTVDIGAYEASSAYKVTTAQDTYALGSLRTAVSWANTSTNANPAYLALTTPAPNTVTFAAPEDITLSPSLGALELSNTTTPVAIFSPAGVAVTISGGGATGVLQVNPNVTAALTNLTITSGSAATGGGIDNAGSLSVTGSVVSSNTAVGSGGGINNTGSLNLTGTIVQGNGASGVGGGISNAGTLSLTNSTISDNSATTSGGGISDPGTLTLTTSQITGNSAGAGGGLSVAGSLTAYATTISGNSAATAGGGLSVPKGGSATLTNLLSAPSTVSGNTAGSANAAGSGGGVDNAGTLVVSYSTITTNQSTGSGGGVDNESGGTFNLSYSTLGSNSATTYGGGGLDNSGTATINVSTIASNQAATTGGGIGNELGGVLTITYATVSANSAASTGGGLYNVATANLSNATVAGNSGSRGGGLYNLGVLTAVNATVAYNSVGTGGLGGGLDAVGGTTALYNTIVAQNQDGAGAPSDAAGSLATASSNDLFGAGGSGGLTATSVNGVLTGVKKPELGALGNNGGPTQTVALMAGSPALDAGSASIPGIVVPTVDQRGAIRGSAGLNAGSNPDIGAFEASSSYLVTTAADSTDMGTLRSAVAWANVSTNANPANLGTNAAAPNTAVFDKANQFSSAQTITIDPTLGPIVMSGTVASGEAIDGTASRGLILSGGGQSQILSIGAGATAILSGLTISGGSAAASGGAISNSGNLTINDSTLTGNTAGSGGGAIDNLGTLTIQSSTLNGNTAGSYGGAVDVESQGKFTALNSTFAQNTSGQGGALYSTGNLTTINDTIAYNVTTTATSGGGLNAASGTSSLYNTIVAMNTDSAGTDPADDIAGTVAQASSYNLVGTGGSGGLVNGQNGNQVGVTNPGLVTGLGNNGGPTQTIALAGTSPAIAAAPATADGQRISLDQRGALRGSPGTTNIDIGSFELSGAYLVTSAADSTVPGTLRSAIDWANSAIGSGVTTPLVIAFDTSPGHTFSTPQQIVLGLGTLALTNTTRPIVIDGPGAASLTISGNNAVGVLTIAPGVNASIVGATIADGNSVTGGGILNQGNLSLGTATVGGTAIASGVAFANNTSPSGSGAAIDNIKGTLTVTGSAFTGNSGSYYGGAIFNDDGTATISLSNFVNNSTTYGLGGAIDNLGGTLTVTGSTFRGNTAFQGGVIYNLNDTTSQPGTVLPATAVINGVTMTGNSAYQGGALFNEGTMSVMGSTAASNTAFQGGAVSNNFGGTMTITDSTLAANQANQFGGAIDNVSNLTLVADTIAYNVVTPGGSGAGIEAYSGSTALYDTIAALNTIGTGTAAATNDITGQLAAGSSSNMVGTGGVVNGVNNNILLGTTNPGLAPGLANNGGPTQTIALYTGSPAIGAGSASIAGVTIPTTDQRGIARPTSGFDIGAFQGSIPAPVTTTTTPSPVVSTPASPSLVIMGPVSTTASTSAIVSGPSPFGGRHFGRKGHRQAKVQHQHHAFASHARAADHHHAEVSRRVVVKVQIEKRHR